MLKTKGREVKEVGGAKLRIREQKGRETKSGENSVTKGRTERRGGGAR